MSRQMTVHTKQKVFIIDTYWSRLAIGLCSSITLSCSSYKNPSPSQSQILGENTTKGSTKEIPKVDLLQLADDFANHPDVRQNIGNIAWGMGYGYYWGCPNDFPGWSRSAPFKVKDNIRKIEFSPMNPDSCPQNQPGLKASLTFQILPEGPVKITNVKESATRGEPYVKASFLCDASAGDCQITRIISTGYSTSVTKTRDFSFGVDGGLDVGASFSAAPFGIGVSSDLFISFKTHFGTASGEAKQQGKSVTESVMYSCPLGQRVAGHTYRGLILSVPKVITASYSLNAKVVPMVRYEGFPRVSDDRGNHWMDHPTDRSIRVQTYGSEKSSFWHHMSTLLKERYTHPDDNHKKGEFSWDDLARDAEHRGTVERALEYFKSWDNKFTVSGQGFVETQLDELVCTWIDVTDATNPKTVNIKVPEPKKVSTGAEVGKATFINANGAQTISPSAASAVRNVASEIAVNPSKFWTTRIPNQD